MIEVRHFGKTFYVGFFRKQTDAALDVDFVVEPGEVFGFLGPNGAGKTTTIKAILGLIKPTSGSLRVLGVPPESRQWRTQVGYMPEHPNFYDFVTGRELVTWFGQLGGLSRHEAETKAQRQLERVGLGHALDRHLRKYSKGMLQRTGLAQALVASPKLLVLDEPMTGLDPIGRKEIRELILELKHEGKTIFYSTHILPDVEMTCDRVSIVHKGRTQRTGRLEEILQETTRGVVITFTGVADDLAEKLRTDHPGLKFEEGELYLEIEEVDKADRVAADLLASGAKLKRFEPHRDDLESIFVRSLGEPHVEEAGS